MQQVALSDISLLCHCQQTVLMFTGCPSAVYVRSSFQCLDRSRHLDIISFSAWAISMELTGNIY